MTDAITLVIPTIWPRRNRLAKALASVGNQIVLPTTVIIEDDAAGLGAPHTRDAALRRVTTPWVAFLDDDDYLYPNHLSTLLTAALENGADYVWSYFDLIWPDGEIHNEADPLHGLGRQWADGYPQTTITTLVRTDIAQAVGFIVPPPDGHIDGNRLGEDYVFTQGCAIAGARMLHVPERTWAWRHTGHNLSGRPWRQPEMLEIALRDPAAVPMPATT